MVDATTTNILLTVPARGNDPGTWDVPVNSNSSAIDGFLGGVQVVSATNAPITLTAPAGVVTPTAGPTQAQNAVLRITGALSGNVQITLPMPGYFIIENLTTGAFVLSFRAVAAGEVIGIEQGTCQHIYNDGTNVRFVNLPPVGTYLDICDATVPAWITACTKPPYLNCNGGTFSAVTYPYLNSKLGSTTLPDLRGVARYTLNQGTARLTVSGSGLDGNTRFAIKSSETNTLSTANLPPYTPAGTPILDTLVLNSNISSSTGGGTTNITTGGFSTSATMGFGIVSSSLHFVGSPQGGTQAPFGTVGTGTISGITLIRAA